MKALLLALMLVPSIAFADQLSDLLAALANPAVADPGDPAFESGPNPYIQHQAPAAAINNQALSGYLQQRTINDRVNLLSPPDVHINSGDDFSTMQLKRTWQQQDAMGRAMQSAIQGSLLRNEQAHERRNNPQNYNRYFGN